MSAPRRRHGQSGITVVETTVVVALLVSAGATFGGALVFEYGFNVETAGDHPHGTSPRPTCSPARRTRRSSLRDGEPTTTSP